MSTPPNSAATKKSLCYATHKTTPSTAAWNGENGEVIL